MSRSYWFGLFLFVVASLGPWAAANAEKYELRAHKITTTVGEDGRGTVVVAVTPVAFDVRAQSWPGRALDPVLHVGDLHFRHYSFPEKGVIRFVASDAADLAEGAEVWLRFGDDQRTRVVLDSSLEVPR